jgi:hypothetical protein
MAVRTREPTRDKTNSQKKGVFDMPIQFQCPHCKTGLETGDDLAGKKGTCPKCGHEITVPKGDSKPQSEGQETAKEG